MGYIQKQQNEDLGFGQKSQGKFHLWFQLGYTHVIAIVYYRNARLQNGSK